MGQAPPSSTAVLKLPDRSSWSATGPSCDCDQRDEGAKLLAVLGGAGRRVGAPAAQDELAVVQRCELRDVVRVEVDGHGVAGEPGLRVVARDIPQQVALEVAHVELVATAEQHAEHERLARRHGQCIVGRPEEERSLDAGRGRGECLGGLSGSLAGRLLADQEPVLRSRLEERPPRARRICLPLVERGGGRRSGCRSRSRGALSRDRHPPEPEQRDVGSGVVLDHGTDPGTTFTGRAAPIPARRRRSASPTRRPAPKPPLQADRRADAGDRSPAASGRSGRFAGPPRTRRTARTAPRSRSASRGAGSP